MAERLTETIQRDLLLRKIALGEIDSELSGYASIDKPWLKYFSEEQIKEEAPHLTCYQNMYQNNVKHKHEVAIEYGKE